MIPVQRSYKFKSFRVPLVALYSHLAGNRKKSSYLYGVLYLCELTPVAVRDRDSYPGTKAPTGIV